MKPRSIWTGHLRVSLVTDRYQAAPVDLIKAKLNCAQPVQVQSAAVGNVVSLMDALKQSVAETSKVKALPRASKPRNIKQSLAA